MILAKDIYLEETYKSNQNVLVLGVPGSGKSRSHVLPNLMEMNSSFLVLDPKGDLYDTAGDMLRKRGYKVLSIDFDKPEKTECFYNPFLHIENEDDIIRVSELLVSKRRTNSKEPFWEDADMILSNAIIGFLRSECNNDDITFTGMMKLLRTIDGCAMAQGEQSTLDIMFDRIKKREPNAFAVEQYELFRSCAVAERTFSSIMITLVSTFVHMMTSGMKYLTSKDTLDFKEMGHKQVALFVKSSDTDRSKDILVSMLFQQAIDALCREADEQPEHRLPVHVHMFLDDFGTNLTINRFDSYIAGMRSRELSCSVILQSEGQLKTMYGDAWTTILGSCQSYVFLGTNDIATCDEISKRINKPLEQVLYKRAEDIYVFTQGQYPTKAVRYNLKEHKHYHFLKDFSPDMSKIS